MNSCCPPLALTIPFLLYFYSSYLWSLMIYIVTHLSYTVIVSPFRRLPHEVGSYVGLTAEHSGPRRIPIHRGAVSKFLSNEKKNPLSSTSHSLPPLVCHVCPPGVTPIPFWTIVVLSLSMAQSGIIYIHLPLLFVWLCSSSLWDVGPLPDPSVSLFVLCHLSPRPLLLQLSQFTPQLYF